MRVAALGRHAPRRRPRRDAPRLQHDHAPVAGEPGVDQGRRHTRGLAGAGLGGEHEDPALRERARDLAEVRVDR